ncbi:MULTISPECIES: CinA family protein [unclassified Nocardioides]|uniref:CinA family protein n=1 Tax=unclassified Nocardioides TaxID=2615069 RepID=UPI0004BCBD74|nr:MULTISPECIES: CinA family protein [unclassified Nocardioides]
MGSPADLVSLLKDLDATLATAESLTGGRVAARVTNVPGSSAVYAGGVVSYQTQVKVDVLGVAASTVEQHGVVSAECAREMAAGVRRVLGTTYAVSTTGVAGPDRQEGKPVGTVFVGIAGPGGVEAVELALDGDRATIQEATVDEALSVLAETIASDRRPAEDSALG